MSNLSLSELRPVGASRNHAVRRSVVDSVMKPHRTRGESKYMLEEIYFSDLCGDIENKDANGEIIGINPQKAWYDNGKYRFQFPSLWYQSACNNKAIGLRNIELSPDAVKFRLQVKFYERESTESEYVQIGDTKYLLLQFLPHTSLMEIMSEVASTKAYLYIGVITIATLQLLLNFVPIDILIKIVSYLKFMRMI